MTPDAMRYGAARRWMQCGVKELVASAAAQANWIQCDNYRRTDDICKAPPVEDVLSPPFNGH